MKIKGGIKIENIKYNYSFIKDGLTYSIDMLHIEFISHMGNKNDENKDTKSIIKYIFMLLNLAGANIEKIKAGEVGTYIENIEPNLAKAKFYNYRTMISFNGITLYVGRFFRQIGTSDSKLYDCENCVRLVYNPNKHIDNKFLELLIPYLSNNFTGRIIKYDLAIDLVGIKPDFVVVDTRKNHSYLKDTHYYGKRQRHGHLKVYNKSKELKLENVKITRIEYTLKTGQPLPNDKIYIPIIDSSCEYDFSSLPDTAKTYTLMLNEIKRLGGNWKKCFDDLNFRMRKKIEPFVVGSNKKLVLSDDDVIKLLSYYADEYNITQRFDIVNNTIDCDFDDELGF